VAIARITAPSAAEPTDTDAKKANAESSEPTVQEESGEKATSSESTSPAKMSDEERARRRAERFGVVGADAKKEARAERFGIKKGEFCTLPPPMAGFI
jgi:hypothetical protein